MRRIEDAPGLRWIGLRDAVLWLWLPVLAISAAHYGTGAGHHWAHDVFRRLYYIPIVLGAFLFGLRGALGVSLFASLVYVPHAFTHMFAHDPSSPLEKALEILLYNVVAVITGTLADREHAERRRQQATAEQLRESLDDLRAMEQQLIRAGRLQSLGELTAGLAHEIKNPLASLKGAAEILGDEIAPDSPRRKMLDILQLEVDRLSALLERFLGFARPQALDPAELHLCPLIERTCALVEAQAAQLDVRIVWERSEKAVVVWGDAGRIEQVLMNLSLNAAQASPAGGTVTLRCGYETRGKRRYGRVTVDDAGPGVPEEAREAIFNPFVTTRDEGTGLGLSIAARIIDQHDGVIEVGRSDAGGASFTVLLPAGDAAAPDPAAARPR